MKKIIAILLVIVLALGMTACTGGNGGGNNKDDNKTPANTASGGKLSKLGKVDPTDPSVYTLDCMTSMGIWETPESADEVNKAAEEMLSRQIIIERDEYFDIPKKNPMLIINPEKTNFYDMTIDDFTMEDYKPLKPQLKLELGI